MFCEGCGPGNGGVKFKGGILGASADFPFRNALEDVVDTCVRDDVCEIVRFSCREMNGCEVGEGPVYQTS